MKTDVKFVVMGDSAAYGTGDVTKADRPLGWTYRLAEAIEAPLTYLNLARPGAKSTELVEFQLPLAAQFKPDVAVVVVGGNDMLRNNFCPHRLKTNMVEILSRLHELGAQVITLQLHDPSKILKLPKPLESALMKRVDSVNRVYEELSESFPLISLKAREIDGVNERKNWHVDMLHPGPQGHQLLAKAAIQELSRRGIAVKDIAVSEIPELSKWEKTQWMLTKGTPWFFKRAFDLLPVALFLILREMLISLVHRFGTYRVTLGSYGTDREEEFKSIESR
ncbi:MAG: SGNH/GDSL hydrolase family protein [Actinobacteria bacterium]|nr:SGNH/GDSL hydrolase family protein [Actinomycetota bacterium]NCU89082.1 SGNH/GDSL hydrolase family protein [Actinomycetota bacterium]NDE53160.1 SGNH/GDSL hydrolase family protein [Actinomycetota bacterium]